MPPFKREPSASSHMALKPGAIAGIAMAATIVLLGLVAVAVCMFLRRRKSKGADPEDQNTFHEDELYKREELHSSRHSTDPLQVPSMNPSIIVEVPKPPLSSEEDSITRFTNGDEPMKENDGAHRGLQNERIHELGHMLSHSDGLDTSPNRPPIIEVQELTLRISRRLMDERRLRRRSSPRRLRNSFRRGEDPRSGPYDSCGSIRRDGAVFEEDLEWYDDGGYFEESPRSSEFLVEDSFKSSHGNLSELPVETPYECPAEISYKSPDENSDCLRNDINPWELEYEPNPVIFSYLARSPMLSNHGTTTSRGVEKGTGDYPLTPPDQEVLGPHDGDEYGGLDFVEPRQTHNLLEASRSPPATTHDAEFQNETLPALGAKCTLDISEKEKNISTPAQLSLPTPPEMPSQSFIDRIQTPSYACPACPAKFSTAGRQRDHFNRKHNRRYVCKLCNTAFNLKSDLQRHEVAVHKDESSSKPTRTFVCPNIGCTTPGKQYARKDNFTRHVKRCEKAREKRAAVQADDMEVVV